MNHAGDLQQLISETCCAECGFHRNGAHHPKIQCPQSGRCGECGNDWPCADHAPADLSPAPRRRSAPGTTSILVARLAEWVDPFYALAVSESACRRTPYLFEGDFFEPFLSSRTRTYHLRRIRWFWSAFANGNDVDPIEINCGWRRGGDQNQVYLYDGHHRFAGAILAGVERIPASFGGRPDLLRYLQGRRKTRPES